MFQRLPSVRAVAVFVATLTLAAYVWLTVATPYLLDSAELASAAFGLGVAHPPGEPLALLWTKLVMLFPAGSVAFRAGLAQALGGAIAASLVFVLAYRLVSRFDAGEDLVPSHRLLLGVAAAFAFAFSPGVVQSATRPEVYSIATAFALGALLAAETAASIKDHRYAILAAFLIGLGVSNHPLLAGATGLGAVWLAVPLLGKQPRLRFVLLSIVALVAGLLTNLYPMLRSFALYGKAGSGNDIVWGDARTPAGLWWVLSGKTFVDKSGVAQGRAELDSFPFIFMEELTVLLVALALAGVYAAFRRSQTRAIAGGALLAGAGASVSALIAGLDPTNPDIRGYLGPALATVAAFAGVGATLLLLIVRGRRVRLFACFALAVLALARGPLALAGGALRDARAADAIVGRLLGELPPRAVLLSGHFETAALLSYQRVVEGRRPDVGWVHLGFVRGPGYVERLADAEPDLAELLRSYRGAALDRGVALALDATRPIHIEPFADFTPAFAERLWLCGATWCLHRPAPEIPPPERLPGWLSAAAWNEAARIPEVRHFLLWRLYIDADLACRLRRAERHELVAALLQKLPRDEWARRLAADCERGPARGFDLLPRDPTPAP